MAGEFGHVALNEDGPQCSCGNRGCWEMYASNSAALRYHAEALAAGRNGKTGGRQQTSPSFEELLTCAERGDLKALEALDRMAHHLGMGIAMLVTGLAPDVIVVVGEVTRAWDRVGPIVTEVVKRRSTTHATTRIMASGPAPQPRLRGIIALVLLNRFAAPSIA